MRRGIWLAAIPVLACTGAMVFSDAVSADELKLKDGSKIAGTIVGFEDNSFKVRTSYGYALVQRDQVAAINITDAGAKTDAERKPEPATEKPATPAKPVKTETAAAPAPPVSKASTSDAVAESGSKSAPASAPAKPAKTEAASAAAPSAPVTAASKPAPTAAATTSAS